jgi:hypothetical protein
LNDYFKYLFYNPKSKNLGKRKKKKNTKNHKNLGTRQRNESSTKIKEFYNRKIRINKLLTNFFIKTNHKCKINAKLVSDKIMLKIKL